MKNVIRITNDGWIERIDVNTAESMGKTRDPEVRNQNNNALCQMQNTL